MNIIRLCFATLIVLFALVPPPASGSEHDPTGSTVVVAITSESDVHPTVPRIIRTAITVQLEAEGIVAIESIDRIDSGSGVPEDLFIAAARLDGDFLLHGFSRSDGSRIVIMLELYDVSAGDRIAVARSVEQLDLTFGRTVTDLTRAIVNDVRPLLASAAAVRNVSPTEATPVLGPAPIATTGAGATSAHASVQEQRVMIGDRPVASDAPSDARRREFVSLSVGFAPLAPMGPAATYYEFGYGITANVLAVFGPGEFFSIGAFVRAETIEAHGAASGATLIVIPFGATVRFSSRPAPVAPFMRLMGGSSLFRLDAESLGQLEKFVPYAGVDLGLRRRLWGFLGLEFGVGIELIFEGSIPLTHVVPAISITTGF